MIADAGGVIYWDSSAVLSTLFHDTHSEEATARARGPAIHLLSSLAWAEVHAVVARIERERALATVLVDAAREVLDRGPWRRVNAFPDWKLVQSLASRWPLHGADLWHLATAKSLAIDLPELTVLSFNARLVSAAQGEGLA